MRIVLVHGGYHGAWCWEKLRPYLQARNFEVLAFDLPGAGERMGEKATIGSWRGALAEVIQEGDILVGHSMGGFVIGLAADEVPEKIAGLVFLAAGVPREGVSIVDSAPPGDHWRTVTGMEFDQYGAVITHPVQGPVSTLVDTRACNEIFYHDCLPGDQAWAFEHLTPLPVDVVSTPLSVPRFWTSPIPKAFIVCTDDRSHPMSWDIDFMRDLDVNVCVGLNTSHSPFISRPEDTADALALTIAGLSGDPVATAVTSGRRGDPA